MGVVASLLFHPQFLLPELGNLMKRRELSAALSAVSLGRLWCLGVRVGSKNPFPGRDRHVEGGA